MSEATRMDTIELTLYVDDPLHELLIAELVDLDFSGFEQGDDVLKAYVPATRWSDVSRERVERWLRRHGIRAPIEECAYAPQDWNAAFERSIQPVAVGPFLLKPTWTEAPPEHAARLLLEIDPKMSFGTGYHESTRLALRLLPGLVEGGERVLDAGTGTGILAIAAARLGAASVVAFDIDPQAEEDATENARINGVADQVDLRAGTVEDAVPETGFDLVLANITREVLLYLLPGLRQRMAPDGRCLFSGLLRTDRDAMLDAARSHGLRLIEERTEGDWWAGGFRVLSSGF